MKWEELPRSALDAMKKLGNFRPLIDTIPEIKGCMWHAQEGEALTVYMTSYELREMAKGLKIVANWLDERAGQPNNQGGE